MDPLNLNGFMLKLFSYQNDKNMLVELGVQSKLNLIYEKSCVTQHGILVLVLVPEFKCCCLFFPFAVLLISLHYWNSRVSTEPFITTFDESNNVILC